MDRYRLFGALQTLVTECDRQLTAKMQVCAQEFSDYRARQGAFPEQGESTDALEARLGRLAGANAYAVPETAGKADANDLATANSLNRALAKPSLVRIQVDLSLSPLKLLQYKHEPPSTWQATPGTITIIHNTEQTFVVWGAGTDGKPIKDANHAEFVLVTSKNQ